jgi:hypothetical protein
LSTADIAAITLATGIHHRAVRAVGHSSRWWRRFLRPLERTHTQHVAERSEGVTDVRGLGGRVCRAQLHEPEPRRRRRGTTAHRRPTVLGLQLEARLATHDEARPLRRGTDARGESSLRWVQAGRCVP